MGDKIEHLIFLKLLKIWGGIQIAPAAPYIGQTVEGTDENTSLHNKRLISYGIHVCILRCRGRRAGGSVKTRSRGKRSFPTTISGYDVTSSRPCR